MSPNDIQVRIRRVPFEPFRMFISDGAAFDVRHPDQCIVTTRTTVVAIPGPTWAGIYDGLAMVDNLHVTRIEPIAAPAAVSA
jgi:hypothetical protein